VILSRWQKEMDTWRNPNDVFELEEQEDEPQKAIRKKLRMKK